MNYGVRGGHTPKRWKAINPKRRSITVLISEKEYKQLEIMRDYYNHYDHMENDEWYMSVSSVCKVAVETLIDEDWEAAKEWYDSRKVVDIGEGK